MANIMLDPTKRDDYNIMCALRGPDMDSIGGQHIKLVTTAVIRSIVGVPGIQFGKYIPTGHSHGGYVHTVKEARIYWDTLSDEERLEARLAFSYPHHFFIHIRSAISALCKRPELQGECQKFQTFLQEAGLLY